MPLDGITCELLTREFNTLITGKKIDKIYMPDKYTIILHINHGVCDENYKKILISFSPSCQRINLSNTTRVNPLTPPSFCMLLRKYLSGAHITSVVNPGFERIIEFNLSTVNELKDICDYKLIIELMGRYSNVILVNNSGKIIDSAIHIDCSTNRVREIMPARIYEYPPIQNKISLLHWKNKSNDITNLLVNNGTSLLPVLKEEVNRPLSKAILNSIKGISPLISQQLCLSAQIDERQTLSSLNQSEINNLSNTFEQFVDTISKYNSVGYIYYNDDNTPAEYSPFKLLGFPHEKETTSLSTAIEMYFEEKDKLIDIERQKSNYKFIIDAALNKATHKKEQHLLDFNEGQKANTYKKYGDLILSNIYQIKDKCTDITLTDYYDNNLSEITIPLNPGLSANDNAQNYYKHFRKAKRKLELSSKYLMDDDLLINYLRSLATIIDSAKNYDDILAIKEEIETSFSSDKTNNKNPEKINYDPNKMVGTAKSGKSSSRALRNAAKLANKRKSLSATKTKQPKTRDNYRKLVTTDGYNVYCGRNNIQNDHLTFSVANKNDWWFHVKGIPGTHVILQNKPNETMPSDNAILQSAQIAAFFSKSTIISDHNTKVDVDYCPVSHVKKIPKSKPGMVIYEKYYTITVTPFDAEQITNFTNKDM